MHQYYSNFKPTESQMLPKGSQMEPQMVPACILILNMLGEMAHGCRTLGHMVPNMPPKWCQHGAKMVPKWSQHCSKGEKGHPKLAIEKRVGKNKEEPRRTKRNPRGPTNSKKNTFKKRVEKHERPRGAQAAMGECPVAPRQPFSSPRGAEVGLFRSPVMMMMMMMIYNDL